MATHMGQLVRRRSPAFILSGIAIVLSFVVVTGVTAALTVPAVSITAQGNLQSILPFNTALYVTADLNPTPSSRSQMIGFASAITKRASWSNILDPLVSASPAPAKSACLSATATKAGGNLSDLGHDTAFVLLPAPPSSHEKMHSSGSLISDLAENFLIVAPLDVHMTLLQALGGVSFTLPKRPLKYNGASIYREIIPACDRSAGQIPSVYYAAVFKGYILLGLRTRTVEELIDTGLGDRKALSSSPQAVTTISSLPTGVTGSFYLNSTVLGRSVALVRRLEVWNLASPRFFRSTSHLGIVAGTAAVQSGGIHVTIAMPGSVAEPSTGADSTELSRLLSSGAVPKSDIAVQPPEITPDWLNLAGMKRPLARAVPHLLRTVRVHTATIEAPVSISISAPAAVPASPLLFLGRAWSAQRVDEALTPLSSSSAITATNTTSLWPQSALLTAGPDHAAWSLADQSLGQPSGETGYQALWDLNTSGHPELLNRLLQSLPFPLSGRLAQASGLSKKSFTGISGSLYAGASQVRTLTVNLYMNPSTTHTGEADTDSSPSGTP